MVAAVVVTATLSGPALTSATTLLKDGHPIRYIFGVSFDLQNDWTMASGQTSEPLFLNRWAVITQASTGKAVPDPDETVALTKEYLHTSISA